MTEDLLFTFGFNLAIVGFFGCVINAVFANPVNEIKYHLYSTFLGIIGLLCLINSVFLK